jgi:hypothetical protein
LSSEWTRLAPKQLAFEITLGFQESLEQGMSEEDYIAEDSVAVDGSQIQSDRAMEAATIRLDFCQDIQGAVAILVLSHKWKEAVGMTIKMREYNLLETEVRLFS